MSAAHVHRRAALWLAALLVLYAAIAHAPVALAWAQGLPRRPFLDELASATAMVGFAILLVEFVLSGRFRTLSGPVGIDLTMRLHQLLALVAWGLIFLHPVLYTLPLPERPHWDATGAHALGLTPAATATGLAAWMLLGILVPLAIFRDQLPFGYETWRLSHGLGAALLAGLALHHTVDAGRYSAAPALAAFWVATTAVAVATLAFVYFVRPLRQLVSPHRVLAIEPAAERTWRLVVAPVRGPGLAFDAGQFAWLKVGRAWLRIADNPFSI